jgi:hypothetical protein
MMTRTASSTIWKLLQSHNYDVAAAAGNNEEMSSSPLSARPAAPQRIIYPNPLIPSLISAIQQHNLIAVKAFLKQNHKNFSGKDERRKLLTDPHTGYSLFQSLFEWSRDSPVILPYTHNNLFSFNEVSQHILNECVMFLAVNDQLNVEFFQLLPADSKEYEALNKEWMRIELVQQQRRFYDYLTISLNYVSQELFALSRSIQLSASELNSSLALIHNSVKQLNKQKDSTHAEINQYQQNIEVNEIRVEGAEQSLAAAKEQLIALQSEALTLRRELIEKEHSMMARELEAATMDFNIMSAVELMKQNELSAAIEALEAANHAHNSATSSLKSAEKRLQAQVQRELTEKQRTLEEEKLLQRAHSKTQAAVKSLQLNEAQEAKQLQVKLNMKIMISERLRLLRKSSIVLQFHALLDKEAKQEDESKLWSSQACYGTQVIQFIAVDEWVTLPPAIMNFSQLCLGDCRRVFQVLCCLVETTGKFVAMAQAMTSLAEIESFQVLQLAFIQDKNNKNIGTIELSGLEFLDSSNC